jgi:hypothetical protein
MTLLSMNFLCKRLILNEQRKVETSKEKQDMVTVQVNQKLNMVDHLDKTERNFLNKTRQ